MALRLAIIVSWLGVLLIAGGCAVVTPGSSQKSLLAPSTPAPDSVTLEVFLASLPGGQQNFDGLWREVDEQSFPVDLRRDLAQNGIRVGVIIAHMPPELSQLLKLTDKPVRKDTATDVTIEPASVSLRMLQLRAGHPAEIQPLEHVHDQFPLLTREDGRVHGRTYYKAVGRLALRAFPEPDGKLRLELTPELEHGDQHQRWVGNDGVMRLDASRSKRVFEQLTVTARLAPGDILVMSSLPERPGSLGQYFFCEGDVSEKPVQKIVVIRAAQGGPDPRFKVEESKKVELDKQ